MRLRSTTVWIGLGASLAACGTTSDEPVTSEAVTTSASSAPGAEAVLRKVILQPGVRITIGAAPDGSTSIRVHVPDGMGIPAGDYTSSSPHLVEEFRTVAETLGVPGNAAWIHVDERNEIVTVSHQVTVR